MGASPARARSRAESALVGITPERLAFAIRSIDEPGLRAAVRTAIVRGDLEPLLLREAELRSVTGLSIAHIAASRGALLLSLGLPASSLVPALRVDGRHALSAVALLGAWFDEDKR